MKVGEAYLHSWERRLFDLTLAGILLPADIAVQALAKGTFCRRTNLYYRDLRIGKDGLLEMTKKIHTLNDHGEVLSDLADQFRRKGLDELPQITEIFLGRMSFVGRRRLLPHENHAMRTIAGRSEKGRELLFVRDLVVTPAKPGLFSTFGFLAHTEGLHSPEDFAEPIVLERLELDNLDHLSASFIYDMRLMSKGLRGNLQGEFTHGHIGMPGA